MKFGVCVPNYGETGSIEALRKIALEAEALGYDSVWTTDHILMPMSSGTPYERILESITSLAYLAAVTSRVKLGISSLILAMRNPIVAVKQLATIDNLSAGRILLATSVGWNENEFGNLGSNFHNRGKRLDDCIRLMKILWEGGTVKFQGKETHLTFNEAVFEPRPVQKKLTIWIAGNSRAAMNRAITYGNAWHPNVYPMASFKRPVAEFRQVPGGETQPICVRIGVNLKSKSRDYVNAQGEKRMILSGDMDENRQTIIHLAQLGVEYAVVAPSPDGKILLNEQIESLKILRDEVIKR